MTFKIFWSEEDQGFVCVVPDLPGCCAVGDSRQEACHTFADDVLSPDSQTDKHGGLR